MFGVESVVDAAEAGADDDLERVHANHGAAAKVRVVNHLQAVASGRQNDAPVLKKPLARRHNWHRLSTRMQPDIELRKEMHLSSIPPEFTSDSGTPVLLILIPSSQGSSLGDPKPKP